MPPARLVVTLRALVVVGGALAWLGTAHTLVNRRLLRRPPPQPPTVDAAVSLLVPARDEAHRIRPTIASLLAQTGLADVEVLVLDDASRDGTAAVVRSEAGGDARLRVITGAPLPRGTLGKPHACAQLAEAARGEILVFVDADVVLHRHAVAAAVAMLRDVRRPLDLLSPWPRQITDDALGRLVQPLLAWSWLTTLPVGIAERSRRPSMAVANGQFLLVEAAALAGAGGWRAVSGAVLDDIGLARAVRAAGGRTGVADGAALASCRMYHDGRELRDGYRKSLWAAFGSPAGAAAVAVLLAVVYVLPAAAAVTGSRAGAAGYAAAVAGRLATQRWCGPHTLDGSTWAGGAAAAAAHPLSVAALLVLLASSWRGHRQGTLQWKGRAL